MVSTTETAPEPRRVDPRTLVIAANVRTDTQVDKTFVSSIKQHGVIVPILVEVVDGEMQVRDGQRRTLAAIEAERADVPIYEVGAGTDAERIIEQIVVNDQRAELSDAEHTGAFKQLSLFGISADAIARKTNMPRKRVELALNVGQSEVASATMLEHQLSLDEAAIVLEFEDNPEDVAALAAAAQSSQFDHEAARIRDRRQSEVLLEQKTAEALEAGYVVVESIDETPGAKRIANLYSDNTKWTRLTDTKHKDCPGRAAIIAVGLQWVGNDRVKVAEIQEVCLDFAANGHFEYAYSNGPSGGNAGGALSDEEKAKRKLVRDNNKLWMPATEVRLAFIKELLQRSEAPSGWETHVARYVVNTAAHEADARNFALKLLDIKAGGLRGWLDSNPKKTWQVLLAVTLGNVEALYEFGKRGWEKTEARSHLEQLGGWGYTLSDIEERVVQGTATQAA